MVRGIENRGKMAEGLGFEIALMRKQPFSILGYIAREEMMDPY